MNCCCNCKRRHAYELKFQACDQTETEKGEYKCID